MSIWSLHLARRRWLVLLGAVGLTALACGVFASSFFVGPADWVVALGGAFLLILCLFGHFSWLLWMIGFAGWRSRPREHYAADEPVDSRTALVMPIYHEDVDRVVAGIRQTWLSAKRAGLDTHCDYYVLSDSVRPEVQRAEEQAVVALLPILSEDEAGCGRLFLVRRTDRVNYKAGNIANFLVKHGAGYDFMLVLDADSVMLGSRIRQLILKMQRRPGTAIIQSLMSTFRGTTPFAQAMLFSISRLGAIFTCGFSWFLGTEALYWGHNAIIRIRPFMEHAQLPIFPGKPPLGGRVLSQDVHEASLLGRVGWDVELDLEPGGSFEEIPSNVISYGRRDQRWCRGDFLNSALILAPGFRTGQRVWLAYAMSSYSISLLLVAMMLLGFALAVRQGASTIDAVALWWALIYMPVTQLGSKFLLFWLHLDRRLPLWRQGVSLFADIVVGLLLTPLLVYQHVTFVLGILVGRAVQWASPSRDPKDALSWGLAARVFWVPTLIAAVWIPLAWALAPAFLFFSGTILIPWLFSIPLAVVSTDSALGNWLAHHGLPHVPASGASARGGAGSQAPGDTAHVSAELHHRVDPGRSQPLPRQGAPGTREPGHPQALHPPDHRRPQKDPRSLPSKGAGCRCLTLLPSGNHRMLQTMKESTRITFNPEQCGGRPCVRGMRIRVKDVLDLLASGVSEKEILEDYPDLEAEDIRACLEYAAEQIDHPVLQLAHP